MKKVIPPILFLICMAIMVLIQNLLVIQEIIPRPFNYFGIVLIITGFIMIFKVRKQFDKSNTEIHTFKEPRKLITSGLFKISRNPIYLGFTISLLGGWILLGSILPIVGCLLFIVVANNYYIPYEENTMDRMFGTEYKNYKSKVRRWI